jgi:CDP-diacylglycerol--glycerol-3-phosphate 3-phosphatidyltransferase
MATTTPARRPPVFNLPNQLTLARFVLALVLFALIVVESWGWCLVVFVVACVTDWLDGYLARRQNLTSTLGRNLDPLVDKVLMCGAYVFLLPQGYTERWLLPWMVTVVVARELVITSLRSYLESAGARFGSDWLGKLKMGLQCAALIAVFVALKSPALFPDRAVALAGARVDVVATLAVARDGLIYAMLAATLLSGLQYLWRAALIFRADNVS